MTVLLGLVLLVTPLQTGVHGRDFEAVDQASLMIDPNSAAAHPPP